MGQQDVNFDRDVKDYITHLFLCQTKLGILYHLDPFHEWTMQKMVQCFFDTVLEWHEIIFLLLIVINF